MNGGNNWAPLALIACLLLAGCAGNGGEDDVHRHQLAVFGTIVEITIRGVDRPTADRAASAINRDFQTMHREWHPWEPGPLVEINRSLAQGQSAEVPDSILPLIEHSRELERSSQGLFNPAIGGLLELWGFHSDTLPEGPPPSDEAIRQWVESAPSMNDLVLEGNRLSSSNPSVQLDFGGYAKGYAVDAAIARLREFGIDHAIVNAGGDLRAIGTRGSRPWRAGVRHPDGQGESILASLDVGDGEAVFTSGNYERYRVDQGIRYSHILDPRTGRPVDRVTSVTVLHANGAVGDAGATALAVAGPGEWEHIARRMGISHVMLIDDAGTVWMTPEMAERVDFVNRPETIRLLQTRLIPARLV